jgi:hypothetical protein
MGKVRFLYCFVTLLLLSFMKGEGQKPAPLIDMHLHVYSKETFQSAPFGNDGISLKSSADWNTNLKEVISKMDSNNIVLAYASGDFEIIDYLNRNYLHFAPGPTGVQSWVDTMPARDIAIRTHCSWRTSW